MLVLPALHSISKTSSSRFLWTKNEGTELEFVDLGNLVESENRLQKNDVVRQMSRVSKIKDWIHLLRFTFILCVLPARRSATCVHCPWRPGEGTSSPGAGGYTVVSCSMDSAGNGAGSSVRAASTEPPDQHSSPTRHFLQPITFLGVLIPEFSVTCG